MTSDRIMCSLAIAVVAVVASAYAYEAKPGAAFEAVKASCRRQLSCSDERIREVVRFSEALVGESDAANRSADEWQKANDERAERLVATQRDDGSWRTDTCRSSGAARWTWARLERREGFRARF